MGDDDGLLFEDVKASMTISFDPIKQVIKDIDEEIEESCEAAYITKEGYRFSADVGYVNEWWEEYKPILMARYGIEDL